MSFNAGPLSLLLTAAIGLSIAGCGGDDEMTTSGTPLSKADFTAQANGICKEITDSARAEAEQEFSNGRPSDAEIEAYISGGLVPKLEDQANRIDELGAPNGDVDQVSAIVDAMRSAIERIKSDPANAAADSSTPFDEANDLAAAYGLDDCANGVTAQS